MKRMIPNQPFGTMSGDLTLEELRNVKGISPAAMAAKQITISVSVFARVDPSDVIHNIAHKINYKNVPFLKSHLSESSRRIMACAVTNIPKYLQSKLARHIKIARFLGLLTYIK